MSSLKSYLAKLEACLGGLPPNARQAVMEELRGHLENRAAVLRAGGLEKEASMSEAIERFGEAGEIGAALRDVHGRGSWGEALAGMLPFLVIGLAWTMRVLVGFLPYVWLGYVAFWLFIGGYLALLIGFGVGWVKGFPRWSYPYVGYVLVFTLYFMSVATPGFRIFNYTFGSNDLWGWRAWIPFSVMAVIALVLTRSVRPLFRLVMGVWQDWTRLSFGLYGIMPLVVILSFDEVNRRYQLPFLLVLTLVLAGGALAYMRSARTWRRALALLIGLTLSWAVTTVGTAIYWDGRLEPWMRGEPDHWYEIVGRSAIAGTVLVALLLAPALLGLLRRSIRFIRAA
jgi:hypothetical protein